MKTQTVIDWKWFPEGGFKNHELIEDWYMTLRDDGLVWESYYTPYYPSIEDDQGDSDSWTGQDFERVNVTHFAFPSDITTQEVP